MNRLFVFTSMRQIREFNASFTDALIPKAYTIDEFKKRASFVPGRAEADAAMSLILMCEACAMSADAGAKLKIPSEFFAFLKNHDYLFSFFKELAVQKKSVEDLKFSDIYASYEEHLQILGEALRNYKNLLANRALYDDITFCELYEINEGFLQRFDEILVEVFGILSEHEWEFLLKCAEISLVKIKFQTSKFNRKLIHKIAEICGKSERDFELYAYYELDLRSLEFIKTGEVAQNREVLTRAFELESLQAAFVFEKISTFIARGVKPENIAVVLPDEKFAKILRLHDSANMLSYAMGTPFEDTSFYATLYEIDEAIKENLSLDLAPDYLEKNDDLTAAQTFLNLQNLSEQTFLKFKNSYDRRAEFANFKELIGELLELLNVSSNGEIYEAVNEELFFIENLNKARNFKLSELVSLLLMRLKERSLDDARGGKVKAIGVLESRGLKFECVIIAGFNDDVVPKRSVNEMFLSSKVREKAGLISYLDRENLQRFYYENLINNAKFAAVSYVLNDEKMPSRFLNEFSRSPDAGYDDAAYLGVFRGGKEAKFKSEVEPLKHDFFGSPLSFSRLNTFLACARKYYYKYAKRLGAPRNLGVLSPARLGSALHEALFEYYSANESFDTAKFMQILSAKNLDPLELKILEKKSAKFKLSEDERAARGWKISELEAAKQAEILGVKIEGRIDRIDARAGELCVLDYKSGSAKNALQLAFYKALTGAGEAYFYDLKETMSVDYKTAGDEEKLREEIAKAQEYFSGEAKFERHISAACRTCEFCAICLGRPS
ncbi:PD-(D/E)XK nuclease family protein [uncultured Campylobacter sp.]|jgi:hypothetical protein|uniref:PD-(D/E)XK nuclease family protein n=1 Tax=uncultured Campylobacter sp. TaxID=218934 RepID=UPI0025CE7213|nr:PD-(D/E)XK nuclease family protein [uncultured Campylobacter sp.]